MKLKGTAHVVIYADDTLKKEGIADVSIDFDTGLRIDFPTGPMPGDVYTTWVDLSNVTEWTDGVFSGSYTDALGQSIRVIVEFN